MQPVLTMTAPARVEMRGLVHAISGHQRTPVPRMSGLPTALAPALLPTSTQTLFARQPIGRWRLRRRRRILLAHRQLPLQLRDLFRLLGQLLFLLRNPLTQALSLALESFDFLRFAPPRHALHGTPITRAVQDPLNCYTEYQCHQRRCRACGRTTPAALPDEIVGQFGPQLTALIAYLTVVCRMPRLVVQRFLAGALQIPISLGSTQAAWEEASAALAAPYAELEAALPQEPVVNADETGHRTNGDKRWLWAFVARTFVVYRIALSRGADVLQTVLGDTFAGVLGSDRLPSYLSYVVGQRQFCWAHFTRNLLSALDLAATPSARRFCRAALVLDRRLFRLWHRFRGDPSARGAPLTRAELVAKVQPIERALFRLGDRYVNHPSAPIRNLARALFRQSEHFFTFVYHDGVAPTNNAAERALRTAVQWRKIMFGTRSEAGERAVERLLTVARTCQLQQLNTLVYLTAAIAAHRRRQTAASLLRRAQTP
jgi:transposase